MQEIIIVKPEKCIGCNACIRVCPAEEANKTIEFEKGKFVTTVNTAKCIACGECLKVCKHDARDFIDDTDECMAKIVSEKMIVLVSPAIKAAFPTKWKGVLEWFHNQGCVIYDVSYGADICTWATARTVEQRKSGKTISQQCPAVVNYIETYQPMLLSHLSPIHSPASCEAVYIKKYQRRTNPIALLTPCIASKSENQETELIDYTVTFDKLMKFFERNGVNIPVNSVDDRSFNFDDEEGIFGILYTRPGGMRENLWLLEPDMNIAYSSGVVNAYSEIDSYAKISESKRPDLYDVLSCDFGCNLCAGAGTSQGHFEVRNNMDYYETSIRERVKGGLKRGDDKLFKKFDSELRLADFLRSYKSSLPSVTPGAQQLQAAFEKMNKTTPEERSYDCRACGHKTCRDMALAIHRGLNVPENCIFYQKSLLSDGGGAAKEELEKLREECGKLIENVNADIDSIGSNADTIDESAGLSNEKLAGVKNLLENVVMFCNDNSTMDEASVSQLTTILETTISALSELDEVINKASENSSSLNEKTSKIKSIMEELNKTIIAPSENEEESE